jgi:aspartate/methionine/tyrosine aminotransferase
LLKVQDTIGICAPSVAQAAACKAIPLGKSYCQQYFDVLTNNRLAVKRKLSKIEGICGVWTHGAYYFFITLDSSFSSFHLAKKLIEQYGIIVLPGSFFDISSCSFRLSYGNLSEDKVIEGVDRLISGLDNIV